MYTYMITHMCVWVYKTLSYNPTVTFSQAFHLDDIYYVFLPYLFENNGECTLYKDIFLP